jgi:WD40 repeat protein
VLIWFSRSGMTATIAPPGEPTTLAGLSLANRPCGRMLSRAHAYTMVKRVKRIGPLTGIEPLTTMDSVTGPPTSAAPPTPPRTGSTGCVAFRADGLRLAGGSSGRGALVWDTTDPGRPTVVAELGYRAAITCAAWNPGAADLLATGCADGTVVVWRVVDDRPPTVMKLLAGPSRPVTSVDWMPDGQHLLCLLAGGRAIGWDALDETYLGETGDCRHLAIGPGGLVAAVQSDGLLSVRDPWRDEEPVTRRLPAVAGCAWSPDGARLAVACRDGSLAVLDAGLGTLGLLRPGAAALRAVTWSGDDLVAVEESAVLAFDSAGRPRWRYADAGLESARLAAAGGLVAVAVPGDRPRLFAVADGWGSDMRH